MAQVTAPLDALVDAADVAQIELYILRRMREIAAGDHASLSTGSGFNLVGLRAWEAGDPVTSIDWAQSSFGNFSPLITRQFEEDRKATIFAMVDFSQSTGCGMRGTLISAAIARCLAVFGFSAAFFQDAFGFVSFGDQFEPLAFERARTGRGHVIHCIDLYQRSATQASVGSPGSAAVAAAGYLPRTSMVPVISDFLFEDVGTVIDELSRLNTLHDVLLVMIDARFAFDVPEMSAGWLEIYDVESGETECLSHREVAELSSRIQEWQESVERLAMAAGLDVVTLGLDPFETHGRLAQLVAERRVRKLRM